MKKRKLIKLGRLALLGTLSAGIPGTGAAVNASLNNNRTNATSNSQPTVTPLPKPGINETTSKAKDKKDQLPKQQKAQDLKKETIDNDDASKEKKKSIKTKESQIKKDAKILNFTYFGPDTLNKKDISTVFSAFGQSKDKNVNWVKDITKFNEIKKSNSLNYAECKGPGLVESDKEFYAWDADSLLVWLQEKLNAVDNSNPTIINELECQFEKGYETSRGKWQKVVISANKFSSRYTGSFNFYYFVNESLNTLSKDFTNKNLVFDNTTIYAVNNYDVLLKLKEQNPSLNINNVHLAISTNQTAYIDWAVKNTNGTYTTNNNIGVYSNSTNVEWEKFWNPVNGTYGNDQYKIALVPNDGSWIYDSNQSPIEFNIKINKPSVQNETAFKNAWKNLSNVVYRIAPDSENVVAKFKEMLLNTKLFSKLVFTNNSCQIIVNDDNTVTLSLNDLNPYYAPANISYSLAQTKLIDLKEELTNINYNYVFVQTPSKLEVLLFTENFLRFNSSPIRISENEVDVEITNDTIKFTILENSSHFKQGSFSFNYQIANANK